MIGNPSDAPTPTDANEWRKSWRQTPLKTSLLRDSGDGYFRSLRGGPSGAFFDLACLPSFLRGP